VPPLAAAQAEGRHARAGRARRRLTFEKHPKLGSIAIGAPLIGWLAQVAGPRSGLLVGAAAALIAAVWARVEFAGREEATPPRLRPVASE
jgi:hypothetical protein